MSSNKISSTKMSSTKISSAQIATGDRIVDPMIALAGCATRQRILVAGSKSMELTMELQRRGYLLAAAAGNCGRPTGQYDVALVGLSGPTGGVAGHPEIGTASKGNPDGQTT